MTQCFVFNLFWTTYFSGSSQYQLYPFITCVKLSPFLPWFLANNFFSHLKKNRTTIWPSYATPKHTNIFIAFHRDDVHIHITAPLSKWTDNKCVVYRHNRIQLICEEKWNHGIWGKKMDMESIRSSRGHRLIKTCVLLHMGTWSMM